jgi:cytochrome c-type biogenesis protein
VVVGISFLTGFVTTASFWLLEAFPALGRVG